MNQTALKLLDQLEDREYELLTWGFVDGAFTREEIEDHAKNILRVEDDFDTQPEELIRELQQRGLLMEFASGGYPRLWRTRFAETVRLTVGLRQMFQAEKWRDSPRLIADFRIAIRPRRYPKRDIPFDEAVARIEEIGFPLSESRAVLKSLLTRSSEPIPLADFQVEATGRLWVATGSQTTGATMICAGTGTGKTLAFYAPCLMQITRSIQNDRSCWTRALAVYPRNELLKDQFNEAYQNARRLDSHLPDDRKICIGAFFGPTPRQIKNNGEKPILWERKGKSWVCPYLRCPDCGDELLWREADYDAKRERLFCASGKHEIPEGRVLLSRETMKKTPPDLLFTTTEMLNRSLNDPSFYNLLAVQQATPEKALRYFLLDEAHTYSGSSGAQAGLLIRRWRHLAKYPTQFVGLSATLTEPREFMGQLIGLPAHHVTVIDASSDADKMEEEGREYQLVLRGDPASQTSLLSASIQTLMLLGRVMDSPTIRLEDGKSEGIYGQKVFAFTDDLDVTNRLFDNTRDAESPRNRSRMPLAFLRGSNADESQEGRTQRFREAQRWELCDTIGGRRTVSGNNGKPLVVRRTSSQDVGVESDADVIVATAALEVGFNDPLVGAVLQHKAPRDPASFLQRKGRAGRNRLTRPWTVVVLSDFGRDRIAYQAYEHLFDPQLQRPGLPVRNRYILRMQAVFTMIDYLGWKLHGSNVGVVWNTLSYGAEPGNSYYDTNLAQQKGIAHFVEKLLTEENERNRFADYLKTALQIDDDDAQAIYWDAPRALVTVVLPTLLRRLESNWAKAKVNGPPEERADFLSGYSPLPDFIPANLFSDLLIPETEINALKHPVPQNGGEATIDHTETMTVFSALRTVVPGRVSRRFAPRLPDVAHWFAPPKEEDAQGICWVAIQDYSKKSDLLGTVAYEENGERKQANLYNPRTINVTQTPMNVADTSNAEPIWRSQFAAQGSHCETVSPTLWGVNWVREVHFCSHLRRAPLTVRRFTIGGEGSVIKKSPASKESISTRYCETIPQTEATLNDPPKLAAVGAELSADGVAFVCDISDDLIAAVKTQSADELRTPLFLYRTLNDAPLKTSASSFDLDWVGQIYLSLVTLTAMTNATSLESAVQSCAILSPDKWHERVKTTLDVIFQMRDTDEMEEGDVAGAPSSQGKRVAALTEILCEPMVRARLTKIAIVLWENPAEDWDDWLRERLKTTLGCALLQACYELTPQFQSGDLILDVESGVLPEAGLAFDGAENRNILWITESVAGGAGIVEEFQRQYQSDPRHFFRLVSAALGASSLERVDHELQRILEMLNEDEDTQTAAQAIRNAQGIENLIRARDQLLSALREGSIQLTHPVMIGMNTRLLRPGSSAKSDQLLRGLMRLWREEEQRLGIGIDLRIFAYLGCQNAALKQELKSHLADIAEGGDASVKRNYSVVYGLLWARGAFLRERAVEAYNPFSRLAKADPLLLARQLRASRKTEQIMLAPERSEWRPALDAVLRREGRAELIAEETQRSGLRTALLDIAVAPLENGYLFLYPELESVVIEDGIIAVSLTVREELA